eukprot:1160405-Pelagomonas_calceolata.AAC.8
MLLATAGPAQAVAAQSADQGRGKLELCFNPPGRGKLEQCFNPPGMNAVRALNFSKDAACFGQDFQAFAVLQGAVPDKLLTHAHTHTFKQTHTCMIVAPK